MGEWGGGKGGCVRVGCLVDKEDGAGRGGLRGGR